MRIFQGQDIVEAPTKAFPTLVKRIRKYRTNRPTQRGYWSFSVAWSIDGENWFKTAKEAKASVSNIKTGA